MATEAKIVLSAVDNTSRAFASVRQGLSGVGSSLNSVKGALAGLGAATAASYLANMVRQAADAIDRFNDLADATGASIENISALDKIARETGGNFEQVSSILVKFNEVLNQADPDTGAAAVLKALNLDAEQLKRLDPAEALRQTAVALEGYADGGNKARAIQELFGRSVREAAPFLKDLAEAGQLNAVVTSEQAAEAEKFNKALAGLQSVAGDAAREIAGPFVASLGNAASYFLTVARDAGVAQAALISFGAAVARTLRVDDIGQLQAQARANENALALTFKQIDTFQRLAERGDAAAAQRVAALREQFARLQREGQAITARLKSEADAATPRLEEPAAPRPVLSIPEAPKKPTRRPKDSPFSGLTYDEQIAQRVGKLFEDSDLVKAKEFADTLRKIDDLFFSGAIGPELYNTAIKGLTGSTGAAADKASTFIREQERLAELLSATEGAGIEAQRRDMDLLAKAFEEGTIREAEYLEAVTARLGLVVEKTKEAKTFAEEFGLTFASAMEDAIVKSGDLSDVLEGLEQDIIRIILRKQVTEPLGNFISNGVGEFFKSLFPSAKGNVFMDAPGLSAYSSSVVSRPTLFPFAKGMGLMGEAGPEAIVPLTRLANGELGVGMRGGAQDLTIKLINQGGTPLQATQTRRTQGESGQQVIEVVLEAVGDALANRSGSVARGLEAGYGLRPALG